MSKRIRELEERLGILLFERSTGGAQLTANGEDFLIVAKRVLADLDSMENYAKATKSGDAGRLHIGFYTALAGPLRDPGPEIRDILLSKLALPGDRPFIKHVKAHHSAMISAVDGERGLTLACESSSVPPWPGVVFREVRDGNGPARLGFVAYWRRNNDNPILKKFLAWLQAHPAVPTAHIGAAN